MRLIADENISWRLKRLLPAWVIMRSNEIKPFQRLSDLTIWQFAKANHYHILTFDEDFSEIQNIFAYPPKIIWLRTGNLSTNEIAALLIKYKDDINAFFDNSELGIFEIY
jgi:predicted nuclease of predicted toxin-antitoxin system